MEKAHHLDLASKVFRRPLNPSGDKQVHSMFSFLSVPLDVRRSMLPGEYIYKGEYKRPNPACLYSLAAVHMLVGFYYTLQCMMTQQAVNFVLIYTPSVLKYKIF
jgi:hypothetical protein